jgi:hypothetical protein
MFMPNCGFHSETCKFGPLGASEGGVLDVDVLQVELALRRLWGGLRRQESFRLRFQSDVGSPVLAWFS